MTDLSSTTKLSKTKIDKGRERTGSGNGRKIQFSFVLQFKMIAPGIRVRAPELLWVFLQIDSSVCSRIACCQFFMKFEHNFCITSFTKGSAFKPIVHDTQEVFTS